MQPRALQKGFPFEVSISDFLRTKILGLVFFLHPLGCQILTFCHTKSRGVWTASNKKNPRCQAGALFQSHPSHSNSESLGRQGTSGRIGQLGLKKRSIIPLEGVPMVGHHGEKTRKVGGHNILLNGLEICHLLVGKVYLQMFKWSLQMLRRTFRQSLELQNIEIFTKSPRSVKQLYVLVQD